MLYYQKAKSVFGRIFSLCVFLGTFVALILCLLLDIGKYRLLSLLPLTYGLCYLLCAGNRRNIKNISLTIINISAILRYIIYPIIIALTIHKGDYYVFDINVVWLLVYELIGVFFVIALCSRKLERTENEKASSIAPIGISNVLLIISLFPITLLYPTLLTKLSISPGTSKIVAAPSVAIVVFTMGIWALFVYLLSVLSSQKNRANFQSVLCFIMVVVVAVYYVLFNTISGDNIRRWQIVSCGSAMLYTILRLFPERKKTVLIGGTVGIISAVVVGSFVKFGVSISLANFVDKYLDLGHFTEYIGGMRNITIALKAFLMEPNSQGIESTLTDLFSGMPIISSLFEFREFSTASIFQRYVGRSDIICPLTAQSVAHFGYVGTPILAMFMTWAAINFNSAVKRTKSLYSSFVLIELVVYTALFMELNTSIIMEKLWVAFIFLGLQAIDAITKIKFEWRKT